jgi:toxin ParE1/3/4
VIRLRLSAAAHRDVSEAQTWYSGKGPGLDLSFREDLDSVLGRIQSFPAGFPIVYKAIRRANLRKFPYSIFYVQRRDHLFVLGVVHHARSPRHWMRRWS